MELSGMKDSFGADDTRRPILNLETFAQLKTKQKSRSGIDALASGYFGPSYDRCSISTFFPTYGHDYVDHHLARVVLSAAEREPQSSRTMADRMQL